MKNSVHIRPAVYCIYWECSQSAKYAFNFHLGCKTVYYPRGKRLHEECPQFIYAKLFFQDPYKPLQGRCQMVHAEGIVVLRNFSKYEGIWCSLPLQAFWSLLKYSIVLCHQSNCEEHGFALMTMCRLLYNLQAVQGAPSICKLNRRKSRFLTRKSRHEIALFKFRMICTIWLWSWALWDSGIPVVLQAEWPYENWTHIWKFQELVLVL